MLLTWKLSQTRRAKTEKYKKLAALDSINRFFLRVL